MIVRNSPFPSQVSINSQNDKKVNDKDKDSAPNAVDSQDSKTEKVAEPNKVSDIKEQIDNGAYKIDINKTADKMAQDLLLDIRVYKDSPRDSQ